MIDVQINSFLLNSFNSLFRKMSLSKCELLKSSKGRDQVLCDGYLYSLNKQKDENLYWCCNKKTSLRCGGRLQTVLVENTHFVKKNHFAVHLHKPQAALVDDRKLKTRIRERAINSNDSPAQIIQSCIENVPSSRAPTLCNKHSFKMMIYRARNKDYPTLPKKLQDFEIPDEFRKCNDQDFLLAHFKDRDVSIIMFGTKKNLQLLLESPYWLMDGTFRCCPWPCYQLYTVHGVIGHGENKKTVPLVYGLLSRKTERCYFLFLELLRTQAQNKYGFDLSPNIVVTGFELAAIKAVKKVYPNAAQKGCFFHLCQSIWRQIWPKSMEKTARSRINCVTLQLWRI